MANNDFPSKEKIRKALEEAIRDMIADDCGCCDTIIDVGDKSYPIIVPDKDGLIEITVTSKTDAKNTIVYCFKVFVRSR